MRVPRSLVGADRRSPIGSELPWWSRADRGRVVLGLVLPGAMVAGKVVAGKVVAGVAVVGRGGRRVVVGAGFRWAARQQT